MGQGQIFLTRVRLGHFFVARVSSGRVSHLWFGLEFGKFPLKTSNFSIFSLRVKKKLLRVGSESTQVKARSASYLLRVKSKLGSGQGPSLLSWHRLDIGIFLWFIESAISWSRNLVITSDWLFQGSSSLHCDQLGGTLTSILLIGRKCEASSENSGWPLSWTCLLARNVLFR